MSILLLVFGGAMIVGMVAVILRYAASQPMAVRRGTPDTRGEGGWSPAYYGDTGGADCSSADSGVGCDGGGGGDGGGGSGD